MASVNFQKAHGAGEAKAYIRHCDEDERQKHEHSNPDIDKVVTAQNSSILGLSYAEACRKYDSRIDELDGSTNTNRRKDRVTAMGLEVPVPVGLPESRYDEWFRCVQEVTAEQYGERNMIEGYIHRDEVHEYIDPQKGPTTSRVHMHMYVVPELEGQLNGKVCMSKASMVEINNRIQAMTAKEYGLAFMDGTKQKSRGSVEDMKDMSVQELRKQAKLQHRRQREQDNREKWLTEKAAEADKAAKEARAAEKDAKAAQAAAEAAQRALEARKKEMDTLEAGWRTRAIEAAREAVKQASKERAKKIVTDALTHVPDGPETQPEPGKMSPGYIPGM